MLVEGSRREGTRSGGLLRSPSSGGRPSNTRTTRRAGAYFVHRDLRLGHSRLHGREWSPQGGPNHGPRNSGNPRRTRCGCRAEGNISGLSCDHQPTRCFGGGSPSLSGSRAARSLDVGARSACRPSRRLCGVHGYTRRKPRVGALIEPLAVAIHAVARALEKCCADSALIIGGGPIGQMLNIALARVGVNSRTQVEPHEARRSVCCSLGACAIDPAALERDILAGRRWPVVFDAVGASQTLESALAAADVGGTVCLVGMHSPTLTVDAYAISTQEPTVVGSFVYSLIYIYNS